MSEAWWSLLFLALRTQRQADPEFQDSLFYMVTPKTTIATQRTPFVGGGEEADRQTRMNLFWLWVVFFP